MMPPEGRGPERGHGRGDRIDAFWRSASCNQVIKIDASSQEDSGVADLEIIFSIQNFY
jgi:hypothetical protein